MSGHDGNVSTIGTLSNSLSQLALLDTNRCASGLIVTSPSRLPAGTTSNSPFICINGSADPQLPQKDLLCRVAGKLNCRTSPSPASHFRDPFEKNRFAA